MAVATLIFIPDITGFTRFVTHTEIEHARHIIAELLEVIIDADELNLTVSEIEGDAVLFYKEGSPPSLADLVRQSEAMFLAFHRHLRSYSHRRICDCGACSTANDLTLKMVAHHGEVSLIRIREHRKLLGEPVILGHRLLKNDVPNSEYLLVTDAVGTPEDSWQTGRFNEPDMGDIDIAWRSLSPLLEQVKEEPLVVNIPRNPNPWHMEMDVAAPLQAVYALLIDLDRKAEWSPGLEAIEFDRSRVPRVGTKHKCIIPNGVLHISTASSKRESNYIEYAERTENMPILGEVNTIFQLRSPEPGATHIRVEVHPVDHSLLGRIKLSVLGPLLGRSLRKALMVFKELVEEEALDSKESQSTVAKISENEEVASQA